MARAARCLDRVAASRPHDLLEHVTRGPARGHRGPVVGQHVVDEARQDLVADRLLGVEVVVQAAGQDAGRVRDLPYGRRPVALLREKLARELHHIGAPAGPHGAVRGPGPASTARTGATLTCRAHAVIIAGPQPGDRGRRSVRRRRPRSGRSRRACTDALTWADSPRRG